MKTSLSHLPKDKQAELKALADKICGEVDGVEMIILFGSFARGDWKDESYTKDNVFYQYKSDFDVLVIVSDPKTGKNNRKWESLERKLQKEDFLFTPLSLMGYDINHVNQKLSDGDDFFCDVKKEGIHLSHSKNFKLERARKLKPQERQKFAEEDFKTWFKSAQEFLNSATTNADKKAYTLAVFELHQTVERLYSTVLKVFTRNRPRLHNIDLLGRKVASVDSRFLEIFPRATKEQDRLFDLLKRAYIDARYDPNYKITKKELEYLGERVSKLKNLTRKVCKEKINSFI